VTGYLIVERKRKKGGIEMIKTLIILLALNISNSNTPPSIHCAPLSALPYITILKHEPRFVQWWIRTQSKNPLIDYIKDPSEPMRERQRAWQVNRKIK